MGRRLAGFQGRANRCLAADVGAGPARDAPLCRCELLGRFSVRDQAHPSKLGSRRAKPRLQMRAQRLPLSAVRPTLKIDPMTLLRRLLTLLVLAFAALPAWAVSEDDLLPVDEAFVRPRQRAQPRPHRGAAGRSPTAITCTGTAPAVKADRRLRRRRAEALPKGKAYTDEFFGDVETYRGTLVGRFRRRGAAGADSVTLKVKYQGCADAGICYPPQTRTLTVPLPPAAVALAWARWAQRVARACPCWDPGRRDRWRGRTAAAAGTGLRLRSDRRRRQHRCCCVSPRRPATTSIATAPR